MQKQVFTRKAIAATFLLILGTNTFAPSVAHALTAGPTSPEATSFEPIDTTDMVNLQTGDFTYNIPLLEVPGPEGGYPLSLSYHAGIQPGLEASWVGLGWTLNPGAVNRSISGFPDDWNGAQSNNRVFWSGGTQSSFTIGANVGIAKMADVNAKLTFADDTFKGFGMGWYIGGSLGWSIDKSGLGIGVSAGVGKTPYDGYYADAGLSLMKSSESVSGSIGVEASTNFESVDVGLSAGVSAHSKGSGEKKGNSFGGLGMNISASGNSAFSASYIVRGEVNNSGSGSISTNSKNWSVY
ncbi:MAG: hypothetical protein J7539_17770, partial [Niabella sp.]|nr:hypothetical protein [Niabella sp.]